MIILYAYLINHHCHHYCNYHLSTSSPSIHQYYYHLYWHHYFYHHSHYIIHIILPILSYHHHHYYHNRSQIFLSLSSPSILIVQMVPVRHQEYPASVSKLSSSILSYINVFIIIIYCFCIFNSVVYFNYYHNTYYITTVIALFNKYSHNTIK